MLLEIDRKHDEMDPDLNCSACPGGQQTIYRMKICREGKTLHILLEFGSSSGCKFSPLQEISDCSGIHRSGYFSLPREGSRNGCSQLLKTNVPYIMANHMWTEQSLHWLPSHCHAQEGSAAFMLQNVDSESILVDFRSHPEGYGTGRSHWKPNAASQYHGSNISSPHAGMICKVCDLCQNLSEAAKILSSLLLDCAAYRERCACILIKCNQASKKAIATIGNAQRLLLTRHMKIAMDILQRMVQRRKVLNVFKAWRSGSTSAGRDQTALPEIDNDLELKIGEFTNTTPRVHT